MEINNTLNLNSNENREFFNGIGGFVSDGREYEIVLDGQNKPPAPWINVISNNSFGFHISEAGAGYTWALNSRENKLTSWSNDPVCDQASEIIYIKDEISQTIVTPISLGRTDRGSYIVRHGFGYSSFRHVEEQLESELTVFTPVDEAVKLWELKLTNQSERERYLSLTYYVEWVLGAYREQTNPYILTAYNNENEYLTAKSIYNYDYRKHHAYIFSSEMITGYTGDRQEFLGLKGSILHPLGLDKKLSCHTGVGYDSCGAIQVSVAIPPKETKCIIFGLGHQDDFDIIDRIRLKYRDVSLVPKELDRVKELWRENTGKIQVHTNDRAIDIMVNGWLIYQTISCRMNARAAFYQCGGAYGFRDQLQDAYSMLMLHPNMLRNQIIISCSRQFEEGDVQHWWHPPMGVGVRTRISDDLLWLPLTTAAYLKATGDYQLLREEVAFIKGPMLAENQHEAMFTPEATQRVASVYEHCKMTIQRTGFGKNGLPLMGGGDWNDGMNEVGIEGSGESVWLAWFLFTVLEEFIPVCHAMRDMKFARELSEKKETLQMSIEEHAWDGEWYLRAFYDDNTKMGSKDNDECKIDSISQSWSVISKAGQKDRSIKAMQSAWRYLVRERDGVSLLLTPPFDKTEKNPGYIKRYYPGIRENGGQYTHAAVWLAIASAMLQNYSQAYTLFTMLNPIHTTANHKDALKYEKEPYVMVADQSFGAPYTGRGGWSWYTGSAGWMYQGLVRYFLGIRKEENYLIIDPTTPQSFGNYTVQYQHGRAVYRIDIERKNAVEMLLAEISLDNKQIEGNKILLLDDGIEHVIHVLYR